MTPAQQRRHDANLRNAAILQMDDRIRDLEAKLALALDRIERLEAGKGAEVIRLAPRLPKIRRTS